MLDLCKINNNCEILCLLFTHKFFEDYFPNFFIYKFYNCFKYKETKLEYVITVKTMSYKILINKINLLLHMNLLQVNKNLYYLYFLLKY